MTDIQASQSKGRLASARGFANESRLLAALLERGYNASRVDLPHSTYDILVETNVHEIVRVQVKTVSKGKSVSFSGGSRGGADRTYKSDVKSYVHSTLTADAIVGVNCRTDNGDSEISFYIIPTMFIERIQQKSLSINKLQFAKNNWELLIRCKEREFVESIFGR
ncbi:MAG: hypothetical protein F4227_03470 [Gammaproteobacteria bacterium]|nr:hypothetical protein [Gammaproteobacteria bacterium]MYF02048.1 hypothetical protein [Gammaproteobacteria bacterium]MYI77280.1 hypothetical protein [Gammaproteobacteria bacterium]